MLQQPLVCEELEPLLCTGGQMHFGRFQRPPHLEDGAVWQQRESFDCSPATYFCARTAKK